MEIIPFFFFLVTVTLFAYVLHSEVLMMVKENQVV